jgi:hypothetical protein
MDMAAGLGSLGFWLFLASIIVGGMWFDTRKREAAQETLRRVVESGQQVSPDIVDKMMALNKNEARKDRELKTAGVITLFVSPGIFALGWFMSALAPEIFPIMQGVSLMLLCVAVGLLAAGKFAERWYTEDQS